MPRYDYRCESCKNEFELVQTFAEAGKGTCPTCSGAGQRVFHAVPVIYKGSGFYTTDYGRPKAPSENKNGASEDSSSGSDAKTSDSKSSDSSASGDTKTDSASKSTSDTTAKSSSSSSSSSSTNSD